MIAWSNWQVVRRQVAICGTVRDANDTPVTKGYVQIVYGPDGAQTPQTTLRADGTFFFWICQRANTRWKLLTIAELRAVKQTHQSRISRTEASTGMSSP